LEEIHVQSLYVEVPRDKAGIRGGERPGRMHRRWGNDYSLQVGVGQACPTMAAMRPLQDKNAARNFDPSLGRLRGSGFHASQLVPP
jgi:hypothetical protein